MEGDIFERVVLILTKKAEEFIIVPESYRNPNHRAEHIYIKNKKRFLCSTAWAVRSVKNFWSENIQ